MATSQEFARTSNSDNPRNVPRSGSSLKGVSDSCVYTPIVLNLLFNTEMRSSFRKWDLGARSRRIVIHTHFISSSVGGIRRLGYSLNTCPVCPYVMIYETFIWPVMSCVLKVEDKYWRSWTSNGYFSMMCMWIWGMCLRCKGSFGFHVLQGMDESCSGLVPRQQRLYFLTALGCFQQHFPLHHNYSYRVLPRTS